MTRSRYSPAALALCAIALLATPRVALGSGTALSPDHVVSVVGVTPAWLARLNQLRALAKLPAVSDDPSLSTACWSHARYMAENDVISHSQDPANEWYSPEGAQAAARSNLFLGLGGMAAIDGWMCTPFHAMGMLDPRLERTGFGTYATSGGRVAAALDVLSARGGAIDSASYPILWPGDGSVVGLDRYPGNEWPDPLVGLGWSAPTGLPIIAQLGSGASDPVVTSSALSADGDSVEHAVLTESTYESSDESERRMGRAILGARDAVVIMPRRPLVQGARYDVSIVTTSDVHQWSFMVGGEPVRLDVSASATKVAYREPVRLTASLASAEGTPAAGQQVVFERMTGGVWRPLGTAVTADDGTCGVDVATTSRTAYRAVFQGGGGLRPVVSGAVRIVPRAYLEAPRVPWVVRRNSVFVATGYLRPQHRTGSYDVRVLCYRRENGQWVLRRSLPAVNKAAGCSTLYARAIRLPYPGRWRIRAYHADRGHAPTYSVSRYTWVR